MATRTTSTPLAKAAEALRCRFTDLAGLYLHPGGSQHRVDSLWWWVKFVYDHSALCPTEGGSFKRVFSLGEGHKSNRAAWVKGKAYLFALAYKYTAHWRACAEAQPQPQQQGEGGSTDSQAAPVVVKPDPEDQLLAWLDLLLLIAWKHMSTQTAKSRKGWLAFPFVTLKRATTDESDPAAAVFSDYEYLGLTTVEEANGWQLEWTEEGEKAFQHWSAREDEIKALGSLRRRLIDDRAEAALADARKALDTAIGRGRARPTRQSKATVIDLTAETVVKLSEEVGALREELSKLLAETKKQKKKRLRVKKEKKKNKKRKKEKEEESAENEESDDDHSDDDNDDDGNEDDVDDDDDDDEIEDEGDDQSQTTLSRKRKRQEEEKKEKKNKSKKKKKKIDNKKKAKKRRTEEEEEKEEEEKKITEPEEQEDDGDDDGDDGEERRSLVRRRKRRARSLFEMRAGSCTQS